MIRQFTAIQVEELVKVRQARRLRLHRCSGCNYPCGWYFPAPGAVIFDSGCDCTPGNRGERDSSYREIAEILNMQQSELAQNQILEGLT